jgi:hypothetical protein
VVFRILHYYIHAVPGSVNLTCSSSVLELIPASGSDVRWVLPGEVSLQRRFCHPSLLPEPTVRSYDLQYQQQVPRRALAHRRSSGNARQGNMRVTQRAPRSCVQCTSRKLRCSKQIPCKNCVERGVGNQCHRESVVLTYHHSRGSGGTSGRRLRHRDSSRHRQSDIDYRNCGQNLRHAKINALQDVHRPPACEDFAISQGSQHDAVTHTAVSQEDLQLTSTTHAPSQPNHSELSRDSSLAVEAAMTLETLAWGRYSDGIQVSGNAHICHPASALNELLTIQQIEKLVEFHMINVAWMHNVIHIPSFLQSYRDPLLEHGPKDPGWLSLYYAVLCVGFQFSARSDTLDR